MPNHRSFATIAIVHNVKEIPGAANIELLNVEGRDVVAKKGLFKKGDMCVYIKPGACYKGDIKSNAILYKHCKHLTVKKFNFGYGGIYSDGIALDIKEFKNELLESRFFMSRNGKIKKINAITWKLRDDVDSKLSLQNSYEFSDYLPPINPPPQINEKNNTYLLDTIKNYFFYIQPEFLGIDSIYIRYCGNYYIYTGYQFIGHKSIYPQSAILWKNGNKILFEYLTASSKSIIPTNKDYAFYCKIVDLEHAKMVITDIWDFNRRQFLYFDEFIDFCKQYNLPHFMNKYGDSTVSTIDDLNRFCSIDWFYPTIGAIVKSKQIIPIDNFYSDRVSFRVLKEKTQEVKKNGEQNSGTGK